MKYFDLQMHKKWLMSFGLALVLCIMVGPFLSLLNTTYEAKRDDLITQKERLTLQLHQWMDDVQTAETIRETLSEEDIDALLTPADREGLSEKIEPFASSARLVNVKFALSPAQKWDGGTDFPGIQDITTSTLDIEVDAPHDGDIFAFIDLLGRLPGKFLVHELQISPLRPQNNGQVEAINLHMKARIEWLANAAVSEATE